MDTLHQRLALSELPIDMAIGSIMARPDLDLLTCELILFAACVTIGHGTRRLITRHAEAALGLGATREQLVETVLQLTLYARRSAVRNALAVLQDVFARSRQ